MSLSFVVPSYRSKETLEACLRSIRNQEDLGHSKIVVVINGPDEGSKTIAEKYDCHVALENKPNRGLARNIGADLTDSEWIAFVDSDVQLDSKWATTILSRISGSQVGASQGVIYPASQTDNTLSKLRKELWKHRQGGQGSLLFKLGRLTPYMNSAACIVSRKAFRKVGGFDVNLIRHQDVDFGLRIEREGYPICFVPDAKADVYFNGTLLDYFFRAFNVGFHRSKLVQKWLPPLSGPTSQSRDEKNTLSFLGKLEEQVQLIGENIGNKNQVKSNSQLSIQFQKIIIGPDKSLLITTQGKAMWVEQDTHRYLEVKAGLIKNDYPQEWIDACEQALVNKGYIP